MKVFKNTLPIVLENRNTKPLDIVVSGERNIFVVGEVEVNSLNVESGSSVTFLEEEKRVIGDITVKSDEIMIIDRPFVLSGDISVEGVLRIV